MAGGIKPDVSWQILGYSMSGEPWWQLKLRWAWDGDLQVATHTGHSGRMAGVKTRQARWPKGSLH